MSRPPILRVFADELIVDSFAGGGGASCGIEDAVGRSPDLAINHDPDAIAMHAANHPNTKHLLEDVWKVNPRRATNGKPVGLLWLSPDCKHFSKAKGGKPVSKQIRSLAWIAPYWVKALGHRKPRVIKLENVEEFADWGPLLEDGRPCPMRKGFTFRRFVKILQNQGYAVDWQEMAAHDYGAPTSRKRLFLVARCDGQDIVWPEPSHGYGLAPHRTAAEIIDWNIPCPSIFDRDRPLADNTLRRIAAGIRKYVVECSNPFIVPVVHAGDRRAHSIDEPVRTITGAHRGELALVSPTLIQTGYGEDKHRNGGRGQHPRVPGLHKPLGTLVNGQKHALVAAFLAKHYGGVVGHGPARPLGAVTSVDHHSLVTSTLLKLRHHSAGANLRAPLDAITAGGNHFAEVRAFLIRFYSEGGQWSSPSAPTPTVTTKDRLGLVTVAGVDYAIVDIGLRMLQPHELKLAQGVRPSYIIDRGVDGRPLSKEAQVRMIGNMVSPPPARALVAANFPHAVLGTGRAVA